MSRNKELAKNTMILTFGKICTQFVSFLLLPLYTAILEPEVYGIADLFKLSEAKRKGINTVLFPANRADQRNPSAVDGALGTAVHD